MELEPLLLTVAAGTVGALVALPARARVPVVVGELVAGVVVGRSGFGWLDTSDHVVKTLADVGFALVMLVAGSHVPLRDPRLRASLRRGVVGAVVTGVLAAVLAAAVSAVAGTGHAPLYGVLLASSSAALVLPVLDALGGSGDADPDRLALVVQIAVADVACVVALPLAADPPRATSAALGGVVLLAVAAVVFASLRELARAGRLARLHRASVEHRIGLDLRISLVVLLGLAALAQRMSTSLLVAGFTCGLMLAALGEPRRLAAQLFAVSDGFLAPVFFVRLGATLDLSALVHHGRLLLLGLALGAGAVAVHALGGILTRQRPSYAVLTSGQLGVPVAAVALGQQAHLLEPGEGAALLVGMLMTVLAAVLASTRVRPPAPAGQGTLT